MECFFVGGLEEIRTPDPRNANAMRSQLRYEPVLWHHYIPGKRVCQEIDASVYFAFFIDFLGKLCFNYRKSYPLEDTL